MTTPAPRVRTPNVRIITRDRSDRLGEGPTWSARENALYWVDILGQRLNRLDLASDAVTSWEMPDTIGWVVEREDGFVGLSGGAPIYFSEFKDWPAIQKKAVTLAKGRVLDIGAGAGR